MDGASSSWVIEFCKTEKIILRDVMEPITYLSGLSTVILGYLWYVLSKLSVRYHKADPAKVPLPGQRIIVFIDLR